MVTAHCTASVMLSNVISIEFAGGLHEATMMAPDSGRDQASPHVPQAGYRSGIVQAEQPAIAHHVGVDGGHQATDIASPSRDAIGQEVRPGAPGRRTVRAGRRVSKG